MDDSTGSTDPTGSAPLTCDRCGRAGTDPLELLTWSTAVERGRRRRFCAVCSRANLRAMEGKLDSEHW